MTIRQQAQPGADAAGGSTCSSLRELMDRMEHSSMRAAPIYQHRSAQGDKMIADAISARVSAELPSIGHVTGANR